jgi:hypothetical protein
MSALGQKQTSDWRPFMSALPPKADIAARQFDVRFVPIAEVGTTCVHQHLDMANDIKTPIDLS